MSFEAMRTEKKKFSTSSAVIQLFDDINHVTQVISMLYL